MGSYTTCDIIVLTTTDANGAPGPFIDEISGLPVDPDEVAVGIRVTPLRGAVGMLYVAKYYNVANPLGGGGPFTLGSHPVTIPFGFAGSMSLAVVRASGAPGSSPACGLYTATVDSTGMTGNAGQAMLASEWAGRGNHQVVSQNEQQDTITDDPLGLGAPGVL